MSNTKSVLDFTEWERDAAEIPTIAGKTVYCAHIYIYIFPGFGFTDSIRFSQEYMITHISLT